MQLSVFYFQVLKKSNYTIGKSVIIREKLLLFSAGRIFGPSNCTQSIKVAQNSFADTTTLFNLYFLKMVSNKFSMIAQQVVINSPT